MDRRKAIKNILALSLIGGVGYTGFRAFELHREANETTFLIKQTLIASLANTIIPPTDTPGAKEAHAEKIILSILINCTSNVEQNLFLEGLDKVERYCDNHFDRQFSNCSQQQQIDTLTHFEKVDLYESKLLNKINNKFFGQSFFSKLKELSVQGYCNSFLGASKGLSYNYIPGKFVACAELRPRQKSWATK